MAKSHPFCGGKFGSEHGRLSDFFRFPSEEWISPRTTLIIERLNKEFRRRTKVMEIVAGEITCYRILA